MKEINQIKNCYLCGKLPKLECDSIKYGNSSILILGESPAKDGWIKSGKAFYNVDGKLQATGKILQRLLEICGLSIDDINFTECCKCIIEDRKRLRECINNCKPILHNQIAKINCEIILPMGQYPAEAVLNKKIDKLRNFIGQVYIIKINGVLKIVIPMYHTSPANPLCYKGNVAVFEQINNYLKIKEHITISKLKETLAKVYDKETAHPEYREKWSKENLTLGQCVPTALLIQYYFGGDIYKHIEEHHYFNIIDGQVIDLTKEQFDYQLDYSKSECKQPDLFQAETLERFNLLRSKVESFLTK